MVIAILITAIISGGIMYFVGANNPPKPIAKKLLAKWNGKL
jgi:hypothetical protein